MSIDNTQLSKVIDLDPAINTAIFIETAEELVNEACGSAGYSPARLTLITTWLAAHFYAIRDRQVVSEQAGDVSATYQSKIGLFLKLTHYGQQALALDTAGGLAAMDKKAEDGGLQKVGVWYVGNSEGSCA